MPKRTRRSRPNNTHTAMEVPASEVKNAWHHYVDRVTQSREAIVVTRYGKPIMKLVPLGETEGEPNAGVFGHLAGTVTIRGDIVQASGESWEADA